MLARSHQAQDGAVDAPRIGVVTVAFRSDITLEPFLNSVSASTSEPVALAVADNDPDWSGAARSLAAGAGAIYLPLWGNPGYGAAVNSAVLALPATVEWVLISNPDVVLGANAIDLLLNVAEADAAVGAVGPKVQNTDGSIYPSAREIPSLRTGIGHALFAKLWPSNPWSASYRRDGATDVRKRETGWLSGSCLLVRREAFASIGGFDDEYFMYFEDVDFGYRLARAGFSNIYEPAAHAVHIGAQSTSAHSAKMIQAHHRSARLFLMRKYSGWYLWPVRAVLSTGLRMRGALVSRSYRNRG